MITNFFFSVNKNGIMKTVERIVKERCRMKKKKRKLRMDRIIICLIALIVFLFIIIGIGKLLFSSKLKVNYPEVINYGSTLPTDYKATYKGKEVSVTMEGTIDTNKLGTYKITFIYHDKKDHKITQKVKVKDIEGPEITLHGQEQIVPINTEFKDAGYDAVDNYDGDVKDKVKVNGKVDTSKEGIYELTYAVKDSHKNETKVTRKVKVTKDTPLNMSVKDFNLNGFYPDTLLKETEDKGKTYSDEFLFMGDSVALYYVINKQIPGTRLWHKEGMSPESALTDPIYINHMETGKTFIENMREKKPKKLVMTMGSNSAGAMEPSYFIKKYKELLKGMMEASPESIIIVQSIPPVSREMDAKGFLTNDKINKLNYYILEMCNELGLPFLNSAEVLKDSNGHLKEGYYITDGVHLSEEGNAKIMKYFQNHVYER